MKVLVPVETIDDGAGLKKGTRIVLKRLVQPMCRGLPLNPRARAGQK